MINIGFLSLDILIIIIVVLALFFISYKTGKKPIISLIVSAYPATFFFQFFPYVQFDSSRAEAVTFILVYAFIYYIIQKHINNQKLSTSTRKIVDYGLLSLAYVSLIISISSIHIPSLNNIYSFSGMIPDLVNKIDPGIILILPLVIILITNRRDN